MVSALEGLHYNSDKIPMGCNSCINAYCMFSAYINYHCLVTLAKFLTCNNCVPYMVDVPFLTCNNCVPYMVDVPYVIMW